MTHVHYGTRRVWRVCRSDTIPIEPAYIDALKHNRDLFSYGYDKGIVLVSHTTLIPILRTVANLWMMEHSNAEAREISDKAGDI